MIGPMTRTGVLVGFDMRATREVELGLYGSESFGLH
jgi:hypothetical protein